MQIRDILLLDYFDGKPVHAKVPEYKKAVYGDDANTRIDLLYAGGWVRYSTPSETVRLLPDKALVQFLHRYNLSGDGSHADLVRRVVQNIPEKDYAHVVPKIYLVTQKGRTEISHHMAYVLNVRENYGLTEGEIGEAQKLLELRGKPFTVRDILYHAFLRKMSLYEMGGKWAKLRNMYYICASFFLRAKKKREALDYFYLVFLIDMSGMGNNNHLVPYENLFPTQKGIIFMMDQVRKSLGLSDDEVRSSFLSTVARMAPRLPFSYFSPTVMADMLVDRFHGIDFSGAAYLDKRNTPEKQAAGYHYVPYNLPASGKKPAPLPKNVVQPHFGEPFTLKASRPKEPLPFVPREEEEKAKKNINTAPIVKEPPPQMPKKSLLNRIKNLF